MPKTIEALLRNLFFCLLALSFVIVSCGDDDDGGPGPADQGDQADQVVQDVVDQADPVVDVTPDVVPDVQPDVEPDVVADVEPDVEPDVVEDVEPEVGPGGCVVNTTFVGQIYTPTPQGTSPNGGVPTLTPYDSSYDAGIDDLLAAVPTTEGQSATVNITVTNATVIATAGTYGTPQASQRVFWLGDANGSIKVWFSSTDTGQHPTFPIQVGDRVSVTVTEVENYSSVAEVTGVSAGSWTEGTAGNDVYFEDRTGGDIALADVNNLVRVTGRLANTSRSCGGAFKCWDFEYGGTTAVDFRSSQPSLTGGECITFLGPVGTFHDDLQLTIDNDEWVLIHTAE